MKINGETHYLWRAVDLIDVFVTEFKAELARVRTLHGSHQRKIQKYLNKINTAIKRCLTFITEGDGDGDPGLVRDELKSLEAHKKGLNWHQSSK